MTENRTVPFSGLKKVKKMLKGKPLGLEIVERKRLTEQVLPSEIIRKVARAFGTEESTIKEKGIKSNSARKVSIYFVQKYAGLNNEEIGRLFGGIHFSAVSKASAGVKEEIAHDKRLAKIVEGLDSNFKA
ncbi:MAG: helix-turn-helix domain-containing protein [Nitrospirota bacterium]